MKKTFKLLGTLFVGALAACQGDIQGDQGKIAPIFGQNDPAAIPGQYIVVLNARSEANLVSDLVTQVGLLPGNEITFTYERTRAFAAKIDALTLEEIRKNPDVSFVEQDRTVTLNTAHNTNGFFTNFNIAGLDRIDQRNLPLNNVFDDKNRTGVGVHAYILDTGINSAHQEFTGRIAGGAGGFTAINDGRGTEDCNDHGSHVASIVGGTNVGVARGVTLHAVRVLDCAGSGAISGIIAGMDFAAANCPANADCVANLSLGGGASAALDNAVTNAVNSGVTVVVAAGNENQNACNVSPARAPAAITVGATVPTTDARASFSNFGTCVDIFGPGVGIPGAASASPTAYVAFDGTSQASPHVAGVVASFLGVNPGSTPAQVVAALKAGATANVVGNAGTGSPNLLLFHDVGGNAPPPPPPPADSCENRCGTFDSTLSCQCDDQCAAAGDCCADLDQFCAAPPGFEVISSANFDAGLDGYIDGGVDAARVNSATFANSGTFSLRLRDNSGVDSSMTSPTFDLTGSSQLRVEFSFIANGMEATENMFIEVDSGAGFVVVGDLISGTNFTNNVRQAISLDLTTANINFSSTVRVRFRCDASTDNDQVFVDDVVISKL
jgi:aqualysin 1